MIKSLYILLQSTFISQFSTFFTSITLSDFISILSLLAYLRIANFCYTFIMTLQFRQKLPDSQLQQIQKENKLLRQYNATLQKENNSRNQERKLLQQQIDRLLQRQRQFSKRANLPISVNQSNQYITMQTQLFDFQQRYAQLQSKYDQISAQNSSLILRIQTYECSRTGQGPALREKDNLLSTIRSLQVKIYTLEAQVFTYQSEISSLKRSENNLKKANENIKHYEQQIIDLQKQLSSKSLELTECKNNYAKKQQGLNKQIKTLLGKVQEFQKKLRQRVQQFSTNQNEKQDQFLKQIMSLQFKNEESLRQLGIKIEETTKLKLQLAQKSNFEQKNSDLIKQIALNQDQIARLKRQVYQKVNTIPKNEQLTRQIYSKDQQITKLKSQLAQKNTIYTKYQDLLMLSAKKQEEIARLKAQISQKSIIFTKYDQLKGQNFQKQQEASQLKVFFSQKISKFSIQITQLQQKIFQFQAIIKAKDEELCKLRAYSMSKQEQLSRMNRDIGSYINKINILSIQLDKLEKLHLNHTSSLIKHVDFQETNILKNKIEQLNQINFNLSNKIQNSNNIAASLSSTVSLLENQNHQQKEHIKDLQRRVRILQDTNINLQSQLRTAIQSRKTASTLRITQNQESFTSIIKSLKYQLQELKSSYQIIKLQNSQLYSQLQISRSKIHHIHHPRGTHHNKSRSRSPHIKKVDVKYNKLNQVTFNPGMHDTLPNNKYDIFTNAVSYLSDNKRVEMISPLNSEMYKSSSQVNSNSNNRVGELQKRIKMLQNQNQSLRHHLA